MSNDLKRFVRRVSPPDVFTTGEGENFASLREKVAKGLLCLGLKLDGLTWSRFHGQPSLLRRQA